MTHHRPQRINHFAPPGSLLKRFEAAAPSRKTEGEHDLAYLRDVRQLPCLKCGVEPCGEAAHVRFASAAFGKASGLQKKPADRWALPLCADCHRLARGAQHHRNEEAFWIEIGINPLLVCRRLHAQAGDLVAMRAVILVAISERGTPARL
jgi:hypothetical protein